MQLPSWIKVRKPPSGIEMPMQIGQVKADPWEWEPDFPEFPARVAYFLATGKIVSYEQITAKMMVQHVTFTLTADASDLMEKLGFAVDHTKAFTHTFTVKPPWSRRLPWSHIVTGAVVAFFAVALWYAMGHTP